MRHGPLRLAARCEQEGIVPDLITIAKAWARLPADRAVLAQQRIVEAMSAGSGFFQHGHTYLATRSPAPRRWPCSA